MNEQLNDGTDLPAPLFMHLVAKRHKGPHTIQSCPKSKSHLYFSKPKIAVTSKAYERILEQN